MIQNKKIILKTSFYDKYGEYIFPLVKKICIKININKMKNYLHVNLHYFYSES